MKISDFFHRFVCLLMVYLLFGSVAMADSVNLSSMTNEEISIIPATGEQIR